MGRFCMPAEPAGHRVRRDQRRGQSPGSSSLIGLSHTISAPWFESRMIAVVLDGPGIAESRSQKVRPVVELGRAGLGRGPAKEPARPPWGTPLAEHVPGPDRTAASLMPRRAAPPMRGSLATPKRRAWHQGPFLPQTRAAAASCGRPDVRDNVDVDIPDRLVLARRSGGNDLWARLRLPGGCSWNTVWTAVSPWLR